MRLLSLLIQIYNFIRLIPDIVVTTPPLEFEQSLPSITISTYITGKMFAYVTGIISTYITGIISTYITGTIYTYITGTI